MTDMSLNKKVLLRKSSENVLYFFLVVFQGLIQHNTLIYLNLDLKIHNRNQFDVCVS